MATNSTSNQTRLLSIIMQLGLHGGKSQAFVLEGQPGVGKTDSIYAIARALEERLERDFPAEVWSGPQIQAEDAAGLPVPDLESGTTRLLPLRLGDRVLPAGAGILCIDEFGSISPSQEAAFLNLLQGGRLGERTLPSSVALGAMQNPISSASNARALSAPAANRFVWINWHLDANVWVDFMRGGQGIGSHVAVLPKDWEQKYGQQASALIASYIKRNPSALINEPKRHDASKAWPSPRSWHTLARLLGAVMSIGERKESDLAYLAMEGCVGEGAAESFIGWLVDMNLPDPEELLADPKNAHKLLPERSDQRAVTLESVANAAIMNNDGMSQEDKDKRWEDGWSIVFPEFEEKHDVGLQATAMLVGAFTPSKDKGFPKDIEKALGIFKKAGIHAGTV